MSESRLVWVRRDGTEEPINVPPRAFGTVTVVARWSACGATSFRVSTENIWIVDLARGALQRLTSEGQSGNPVWTADGTRLFYERRPAAGAAVMTVPADAQRPAVGRAHVESGSGRSNVRVGGWENCCWGHPDEQKLVGDACC